MPEDDSEINRRAQGFFYPRGPVGVLLIHGFSGSLADLSETASRLAAAGYSVLGVRIAGHGSQPEVLRKTTTADWLNSVKIGLEELLTAARQVIIIGDSFGGNLGLDLAVKRPDVIRGVVLLSTPAYRTIDLFKRLVIPLIEPWRHYQRKKWVTPNMVEQHLAKGSYLSVPLKSYARMLEFIAEQVRQALKKVTCPVLMVYLRDDQVVAPNNARFIFQRLGSNDKQLFWVQGQYHHPLTCDKSEVILKKIIDFINHSTTVSTTGTGQHD